MRRIAAACALLVLAACSSAPPLPAPPPDPATQMSALEQRIAILIEEQREKLGPNAHPLAIDPELGDVARAHSRDMAAGKYFAHASPKGETTATLLMAADPRFQGLLGENIGALHYAKQSGIDVAAFARAFLEQWLKSPQHRDNMTMADYTLAGIGAAVDGDTVYVTVLFATDLGMGPHADRPAPN
ncbi:MAG: CAP domain-containing protein [Alphaproteobacteria bacterium]|nr:CAP domain-containing protein [Alphaproteobacteria bacterium]